MQQRHPLSSADDAALRETLRRLRGSRFRARFHLQGRELDQLRRRGLDAIRQHAHDLLTSRLAPADPPRDGSQTPWRGHPVFVAQHATATCCRGCLEKWHGISQGRPMSAEELQAVVELISKWLEAHLERTGQGHFASDNASDHHQPTLF